MLGLVSDVSGTTFAHLTNTTITPFVRLAGDRGLFNLVDGLDGYVYAIGSGSLSGPFGTSIVRFTPSALSAPRGVRIVR